MKASLLQKQRRKEVFEVVSAFVLNICSQKIPAKTTLENEGKKEGTRPPSSKKVDFPGTVICRCSQNVLKSVCEKPLLKMKGRRRDRELAFSKNCIERRFLRQYPQSFSKAISLAVVLDTEVPLIKKSKLFLNKCKSSRQAI